MSGASGSRHRQDSTSSETRKAPGFYWVLESESPIPTDEDSESINSIQGYETAFARDTSDTDSSYYGDDRNDFVVQVEYEVDSDADINEKAFELIDSSSGIENKMEAVGFIAMCDSDLGLWADTEDSKSGGCSTDSELGHADYWECIQCKNKNNNPLFRYCEKCYRVRKNFFPPRPKAKKKKSLKAVGSSLPAQSSFEISEALTHLLSDSVNKEFESETLSQTLSQDSGVGTGLSQDIAANDMMSYPCVNKVNNTVNIEGIINVKRKLEVDEYFKEPLCKRVKIETVTAGDKDSKNEPSSSQTNIDNYKTVSTQTDNLDSNSTSTKESTDDISDNMCITCTAVPANAMFVHTGMGHICCCYQCAMKVWSQTKKCPLCNRKVSNVIKAFMR